MVTTAATTIRGSTLGPALVVVVMETGDALMLLLRRPGLRNGGGDAADSSLSRASLVCGRFPARLGFKRLTQVGIHVHGQATTASPAV